MSQTPPDTSSRSALLAWIKDPARRPAELTAATGFFPETDRAIAARVDCPPDVLAALSHSSDKATRAKVTANPNTPAADYVRLGQQFPKEFIANPLLDLLLLENPALFDEVPAALLVQIAKKPECPAAFLIWAASHADEKVQLAVAMNAKAPAEAVERLRQSAFAKVRESASAAGAAVEGDSEVLFREAVRQRLAGLTPEEAKEAWDKKYIGLPQFHGLDPVARSEIQRLYLHTSARRKTKALVDQAKAIERGDILFFVGTNANKVVLSRHVLGTVLALCAGPFVEPSRIARVSGSTEWLIRAAAARNKSTPPNILSKLITDAHPVVRALAAAARGDARESVNAQPEDHKAFDAARATVEIRKAFKGKVGKSTRDTVASDPRSPVQLLKMLSKDKDSHVRRSVALNPSSPVALLEALAKDTSSGCSAAASRARKLMGLPPLRAWDVPIAVARNLNTPVTLLEALAKEPDSGLRGSVAENRNTSVALLQVLAKDKDSSVRRSVAENPNTPVAMLEALASDMDSWVRESVAKNPSTPVAALEALVEDDKSWVRHGVAGNPATPVGALERLAKESDARVFVASNPSTPPELSIPLLEALAKDTAWQVRRTVAENPNTPVSVLRDLAKSKVELVRSAVAGNPSTPASLLDILSKDKEESVRQSAARTHQALGASVEQAAQDLAGEAARFHEEALAMLSPRDKSVLPESSILEWLERLFALPAASDNKTLTKASRNKNWLVRLGVALHPQASDAMLEFLSADADADVAAAARAKLSQRSRC